MKYLFWVLCLFTGILFADEAPRSVPEQRGPAYAERDLGLRVWLDFLKRLEAEELSAISDDVKRAARCTLCPQLIERELENKNKTFLFWLLNREVDDQLVEVRGNSCLPGMSPLYNPEVVELLTELLRYRDESALYAAGKRYIIEQFKHEPFDSRSFIVKIIEEATDNRIALFWERGVRRDTIMLANRESADEKLKSLSYYWLMLWMLNENNLEGVKSVFEKTPLKERIEPLLADGNTDEIKRIVNLAIDAWILAEKAREQPHEGHALFCNPVVLVALGEIAEARGLVSMYWKPLIENPENEVDKIVLESLKFNLEASCPSMVSREESP